MNDTHQSATPNDALAELIAEALLRDELIAPARREELLRHLKNGTAKEGDWLVLIESAMPAGSGEKQ